MLSNVCCFAETTRVRKADVRRRGDACLLVSPARFPAPRCQESCRYGLDVRRSADESRRRPGRDVDTPWRRVAATAAATILESRRRRGRDDTSRGDAAAAAVADLAVTGPHVDIPSRRAAVVSAAVDTAKVTANASRRVYAESHKTKTNSAPLHSPATLICGRAPRATSAWAARRPRARRGLPARRTCTRPPA